MINGRIVVENHKLLTEDEKAVIAKANESAERISCELASKDWSADLPLAKLTTEGYY